ncbi:DUF5133 domain-containing protein [Streptomyces sp. NPDC051105]|uniref:DUF5133 domain-containing protein n=1 Tax=Streptomyces sp. NPDC051105 TaxID=3154843 RepID=UPI00343FD564
MLMPHPVALRRLLTEYETRLAIQPRTDGTTPDPRLQDLAYTLCVSTGTREIDQALLAAHDYLERPIEDPVEDPDSGGEIAASRRVRTVVAPGQQHRTAGATPLLHS